MALNTGNPFLDALGGTAWLRTAANTTPYGGTLLVRLYFDNDTSEGHSTGGAWTDGEKASFREAMSAWSSVANIRFIEVDTAEAADLIERKVTSAELDTDGDDSITLGSHDFPGGRPQIGLYNIDAAWTSADMQPGGMTFETFVHELGHALGLAHPHDLGGGTGLFPGIEAVNDDGSGDPSDGGSWGLNSVPYTVMSYNDGPLSDWEEQPDRGFAASALAFDIATIQLMYGAVGANFGDTVYMLRDDAPGNSYMCIWDTDGVDTIRYDGASSVTINLQAATLRNEPGGGGYLSFVHGVAGGFTIAADVTDHDDNGNFGVIIENAVGGSGHDVLVGNEVSNRLEGREGFDYLDGGAGLDTLIGGAGDDTYILNDVSPVFFAGLLVGEAYDTVVEAADEGRDTVVVRSVTGALFDPASYTLGANIENGLVTGNRRFDLRGNSLDNQLGGNSASNTLEGRDGDDTLDGGGGRDLLVGGTGNDTYILRDVTATVVGGFPIGEDYDTVVESADGGIDWIKVSFAAGISIHNEYTLGDFIENGAVIGDEAFDLTGNALDNWLIGNDASNTLIGLAGNDLLSGFGGLDILMGGTGDDTYYLSDVAAIFLGGFPVGEAYDTVYEAADEGIDWVIVSSGVGAGFHSQYTLTDNVENGRIAGVDSFDLIGNELDNILLGNDGANTLVGLGGNDTFDGGHGHDTLVGGSGDDTYILFDVGLVWFDGMPFGELYDTVVEEADDGIDWVLVGRTAGLLFDHTQYTLTDNVENARITGDSAFDVTGNGLDNELHGNDAANRLRGLAGNDLLDGGAGDDVLDGGEGDDLMSGGAGADVYYVDSAADQVVEDTGPDNDTVYASISYTLSENVETLILQGDAITGGVNGDANWIYGNARNNVLSGNAGDDRLLGGAGQDRLLGGTGDDRLDGGAGADRLTGGAGRDTFVFVAGEAAGDVITDFAGRGGAAGDMLTFVGFGTAAQGATLTRVAGSTDQWQIHSGLDGHDEQITLSNHAAVHTSDYAFV